MVHEQPNLVTKSVGVPHSRGLTTQGVLVSVSLGFAVAVVQILAFSYLRKRYRSIYEPRTFMVPKFMRVSPGGTDFLGWIKESIPYCLDEIPRKIGLDPFFFLRYLIIMMILTISQALVSVPILLPLHATGGRSDVKEGLEKLTTSHIAPEKSDRFIAHIIVGFVSLSICFILFKRELRVYHEIRAEHMVSRKTPQESTTILIKGLYPEYRSRKSLMKYYGFLSNSISRIWFNYDYRPLETLVSRQKKLQRQIERILLRTVTKCQNQSLSQPENLGVPGMLWRAYLDESQLPGCRRQDLAELKSELNQINAKVHLMQTQSHLFEPSDSCFVKFDSQVSSFMAFRSTGIRSGGKSTPGAQVYDQVYPSDIIWGNLNMPLWLDGAGHILAVCLDYLVILGWAVPVAAVSMVTQLENIVMLVPSLSWLRTYPTLASLMNSVVSPLALSYLTSHVPGLFRIFSRMKGYPTLTLVELDVQRNLFLFLYVQLFLIVTMAAGIPTLVFTLLLNTSEGVITLADSLPKAANFFMSYLITSALTLSGNSLLQFAALRNYLWRRWLVVTPRDLVDLETRYPVLSWGTVYPMATNITAIAMSYALVCPLILPAAAFSLAIMFVSFKTRIIFSYVPQYQADGDYYPTAIFQVFLGLYCQQLSLLGGCLLLKLPLYSLLAVVLFIATICAHRSLRQYDVDLKDRIPLNNSNLGKKEIAISKREITTHDPFDEWEQFFAHVQNVSCRTPLQRDYMDHNLFEHPVMRAKRPCIWLPDDQRSISKDQIEEMRSQFTDLRASCKGTNLTEDGEIQVTRAPPDFEFRN